MFGWPLAALALFARLPPRRAMLATVVAGWLFLPVASYDVEGLPAYSKVLATCGSALLAALLLDRGRLRALRPRLVDAPIAVLCLSPIASSLANGLGAYEALSAVFAQLANWGLPYLLGRLYIVDLECLADLAAAVVLGGLAYAPLCLVEVLLGPELHRWVYGYSVANSDTVVRFGGWRPYVFMDHGLEVALWMASASVVAVWAWRARAGSPSRPFLTGWVALTLTLTTALAKSVNGWIALLLGAALLLSSARTKSRAPVLVMAATIVVYVALRAGGLWSGREIGSLAALLLPRPAVDSLLFRLDNESLIANQARQRLLLGWGRGAEFPFNAVTSRPAIPDSLWIVTFLPFGLLGLAALGGSLLAPPVVFVWRYPPRWWLDPHVAPGAGAAVVVLLYATDCLANAMLNPIYVLAAGGLVSVASAAKRARLPAEPKAAPSGMSVVR